MEQKINPLISADSRLYRYNQKYAEEYILYTTRRTGYLEMQPGYYLERQNFNSYCISVTVEGNGLLDFDGKEYNVSSGCVTFFNQNTHHVLRNATGEKWSHYYIYFWGPQSHDFFNIFYEKYGAIAKNIDGRLLIDNIVEIHKELTKQVVDAVTISQKIYEMLLFLYRNCASDNNEKNLQPALLAESFIREHYNEKITLDDVAADVNVSKYYLSHIYKKVWGFSPIKHLLVLRFEKALELIQTTDLTISEILSETNFENYHLFIKMCKQRTGATPSALRNKMRKSK